GFLSQEGRGSAPRLKRSSRFELASSQGVPSWPPGGCSRAGGPDGQGMRETASHPPPEPAESGTISEAGGFRRDRFGDPALVDKDFGCLPAGTPWPGDDPGENDGLIPRAMDDMMASGSAHAPVDRSFRARDEVVARSDLLIVGDPCAESRA